MRKSHIFNKSLRGGSYIARHLMVATIYHHGSASNADTDIMAESELDFISK